MASRSAKTEIRGNANELLLYATNLGDLYREYTQPIQRALVSQKRHGAYRRSDAIARFLPMVSKAAARWNREFGSDPDSRRTFSSAVQREVAGEMVDRFEVEYGLGNMDYLVDASELEAVPSSKQIERDVQHVVNGGGAQGIDDLMATMTTGPTDKDLKLKDRHSGNYVYLTVRGGVVVGAMGSDPKRFVGLTVERARHIARHGGKPEKTPVLDWSLVPGTKREQIAEAHRVRRPIKIEKAGSKWAMIVLGVQIGVLDTKEAARSAAHTIGRYKLDLGDFVSEYTEGYR